MGVYINIKGYLLSNDPLSDEALDSLVRYKEEDLFVDYKENLELRNEKHWMGLTKDAIAFANTYGGYIVFGVRFKPFELVGLTDNVAEHLADVNNVSQKLNRYVAPVFTGLRSKIYELADKNKIVVLYIPESKGRTHIIIKEANYKYPDGRNEIILRPGMIYVRRSGTNQIMSSEDFESLLERRVEYIKESLFSKISKVIHAPSEHQLVIVDPKSPDAKKIKISGDQDALPVKGIGFSTPPSSDQEEIAAWIALKKRDVNFVPPCARVWYMYSVRSTLRGTLDSEQVIRLIVFNVMSCVPIFYWLRKLGSDARKEIITQCFEETDTFSIKVNLLHVGAFLGKGFYNSLLRKMRKDADRLSSLSQSHPGRDRACEFFHQQYLPKVRRRMKEKDIKQLSEDLENRLNHIASEFANGRGEVRQRWEAEAIDCYLYSPEVK